MVTLQTIKQTTGATHFKIMKVTTITSDQFIQGNYMNEFNLTDNEIRILNDDIRQSSTTQLRKVLKEDIPVELDDMINYELYIREFS